VSAHTSKCNGYFVNFYKSRCKGVYEIQNKIIRNKRTSIFKRNSSKPADTNLQCICERTQIQLDWILCELSQTQMYAIFVNIHRSQFTERSVRTHRSRFNRPYVCHQRQISEKFLNTDKPKFTA
jgi:hypothetical protein